MKIQKEQTKTQYGLSWPIDAAVGGGSGMLFSPLAKATRGSGAAEGKNDYDRPCEFAGAGAGLGGLGGLPTIGNQLIPWTLPRYRVMALDPTLALAEAATLLTILAAEWSVSVDKKLGEDPVAQRGKAILEAEFVKRRQRILRGALQSLRYGWKDFEIVYIRKTDDAVGGRYVGIKKFKQLSGDFITFDISDAGDLVRVKASGAPLEAPYFLHLVNEKEDDNWFGFSRYERCRRAWANSLHLEDKFMQLVRKGSGTTPMVGVPADDPMRADQTKQPNIEAGLTVARALADGQAVAYYRLSGISDDDIAAKPELAGASSTKIDFIDVGNPGPSMAAIDARLANLDKLKLRGWFKPERTLTEATTGGSRADSESHGDLSVADCEATHEDIVEQLNEQTVAALIRENCGEEYVEKIKLLAVPLQDDRRQALAKFFESLMEDAGFRTGLIKALGSGGIEGLVDKLGLDIHLEPGKFKLEETDDSQPAPGAGGRTQLGKRKQPPVEKTDGDDRAQLSAEFDEEKHPRGDDGKFVFAGSIEDRPEFDPSHVVDGVKPTNYGLVGPQFYQFHNKPAEAAQHLMKVQAGEVPEALEHPAIGKIDLIWGGKNFGLGKIVSKHPEIDPLKLHEFIRNLPVLRGEPRHDSIELGDDKYTAVVKRVWGPERHPKRWLLTAFDDVKRQKKKADI